MLLCWWSPIDSFAALEESVAKSYAILACGHTWKVQQNILENSRKKLMGFHNVKASKPRQRNNKPPSSWYPFLDPHNTEI